MNERRSRRISQKDIPELLPKWFVDSYTLTFHLLETNSYVDFTRIKCFLIYALGDIPLDSDEERKKCPVKHIKVKVDDKGVHDLYQYVSVDVYVVMRDGNTLRISKSCKVKLRRAESIWD